MHDEEHDSMSVMSICTFPAPPVKWMVIIPPFLFNVPFFIFPLREKLDVLTVRRSRYLLRDRGPLPSSVFDRVEVRGLRGSVSNEAPMTWLEIIGIIGNLLSVVDAHPLVACSVQLNIVERAHGDNPVWSILRRKIPLPRRVVESSLLVHGRVFRVDVPNEFCWLS